MTRIICQCPWGNPAYTLRSGSCGMQCMHVMHMPHTILPLSKQQQQCSNTPASMEHTSKHAHAATHQRTCASVRRSMGSRDDSWCSTTDWVTLQALAVAAHTMLRVHAVHTHATSYPQRKQCTRCCTQTRQATPSSAHSNKNQHSRHVASVLL